MYVPVGTFIYCHPNFPNESLDERNREGRLRLLEAVLRAHGIDVEQLGFEVSGDGDMTSYARVTYDDKYPVEKM